MKPRPFAVTLVGNLLIAALAVAWAYASYRYNLLNVGGDTGDVDFWYRASDIAYVFLSAWLGSIAAILFTGIASRMGRLRLFSYTLVTFLLGPALVFGMSWWLHRGFPPCNC